VLRRPFEPKGDKTRQNGELRRRRPPKPNGEDFLVIGIAVACPLYFWSTSINLPAAPMRPSYVSFSPLSEIRGRREGRVALHPGPPRKEICASARQPQVQAETLRPSLRDGLRLIRALPGEPAFATVISAMRSRIVANLTPALARQDHTTSPYASATLVARYLRVHRIPPHVS
jgi:hypothetical protein